MIKDSLSTAGANLKRSDVSVGSGTAAPEPIHDVRLPGRPPLRATPLAAVAAATRQSSAHRLHGLSRVVCLAAATTAGLLTASLYHPVAARPALVSATGLQLSHVSPPCREDGPAVAAPKCDASGHVEARFMSMHASFLERKKQGPIDLLFIGDSITEWWKQAPQLWQSHYGGYEPANFGIAGDQTQHVLWRLDNGELEGIQPRVVVLMIGTNDIGLSSRDMGDGVLAVVGRVREKLPQSKLLLLGIFPRGTDAHDPTVAAQRAKIAAVNRLLAKLDDGRQVRYLDIGPKFLQPDGSLPTSVMPDGLHPNQNGYRIWADAMQPVLDEMMR